MSFLWYNDVMASDQEKHITLGVVFGLAAALLVFVGVVASGGGGSLSATVSSSIFDGEGLPAGLEKASNELSNTGIRTETDIVVAIGKIINYILMFVAIIVFVMILIAGFILIFSFGSDTAIQRAKKILIWSVVGLVVIILAYVIVEFVVQILTA